MFWFKVYDKSKKRLPCYGEIVEVFEGFAFVRKEASKRELKTKHAFKKICYEIEKEKVPDHIRVHFGIIVDVPPRKKNKDGMRNIPSPAVEQMPVESVYIPEKQAIHYKYTVISVCQNLDQFKKQISDLAKVKYDYDVEVILSDNGNMDARKAIERFKGENLIKVYTNNKSPATELKRRLKAISSGESIIIINNNKKIKKGWINDNIKTEQSNDFDVKLIRNRPLVSIITTTYDRKKCLESLLNSHKQMTVKDIEVIIVNDGGFENKITDVITKSGIENLICINYAKNKGLYPAQNYGYKISSGQYVCTIDDDDHYFEDGIEKMVKAFEPDISVVFARCERHKTFFKKPEVEIYPKGLCQLNEDNLFITNWNHASARMFRRECIDQIGINDLSFKWLNDWEYGIRLARNYVSKSIEDVVSIVYLEDGGMTRESMHNKHGERKEWNDEAEKIKNRKVVPKFNFKKEITVSMIIPLYKTTTWSRGALLSVLNMSNSLPKNKVEVILIDDGSPEDEYENLKKIIEKHDNVKYYGYSENKGISGALNEGLKYCTGDYVGFIGADDEVYQGTYDIMVRELERNRNCVLAYGDINVLDNNGSRNLVQYDYSHDRLLINNYIGKFMLWRKGMAEKAGCFDESLKVALDWDMWLKMAKFGDLLHVPVVMGIDRVHDDCTHRKLYDVCTEEIKTIIKRHTGKSNFELDGHMVIWK